MTLPLSNLKQKKTILFYSTHKSWGGSEKYWYEMILHPAFAAQFKPVVMLHEDPALRARADAILKLGGEVIWYHTYLFWLEQIALKILKSFKRFNFKAQFLQREHWQFPWLKPLKTTDADLVWFNISGANALTSASLSHATQICEKKGLPYWLIFQHMREDFLPDQLEKLTHMIEGAQRVIFIARRNQMVVERCLGGKLPNAVLSQNAIQHSFIVDAAAKSAANPVSTTGKVRLLLLGQLVPGHKGQHILFEVLTSEKWRQRDWELTLLGGGNKERIERLIRYFNFPVDRLHMPGFSTDVITQIIGYDLLIMPSLSEGTPFAMVECMACGRPAVGTPVGGIPELIGEGKTGWLARSTQVEDVDAALEKAWGERHLWPAYGQNAQQMIAQKYDQDKTIASLIQWLGEDCR